LKDKLEGVKSQIAEKYPDVNVRVYLVAIQNQAEVKVTVKSVVSELGGNDILVNNVRFPIVFL
jgi:NADP-dependent 3-hydroxy acid dehydrogenase YdfG